MCKCNPNIKTMYCGRGACRWTIGRTEELKVENTNPCIYVFINKSLDMSKGKMAAQAVHAAVLATIDAHDSARKFWTNAIHRTVLIMEARDSEHIQNIKEYLEERKLKTYKIIDEGVNEIDPIVPTALSTSILDKNSEDVKAALSSFNTYHEKVRLIMELNI